PPTLSPYRRPRRPPPPPPRRSSHLLPPPAGALGPGAPALHQADRFAAAGGLPPGQGRVPARDQDDLSDPRAGVERPEAADQRDRDRKSTCLNSSHVSISYAVFCSKT